MNKTICTKKKDILDVIYDAHLAIGQGGRNEIIKETQTKHKNITTESIMLYLNLCIPCLKNSKVQKKMFGDQTSDIQ